MNRKHRRKSGKVVQQKGLIDPIQIEKKTVKSLKLHAMNHMCLYLMKGPNEIFHIDEIDSNEIQMQDDI